MAASLVTEIECVRREPGTRTHVPHLDGMRGLASVFVVMGHLWLAIHGMQASRGLAGLLTNWLLYGHLAVDLFIVLSGFCLALPYAGLGPNARVSTSRFYFKRARRMLPPYFAAITISILLAMLAQIFFSTSHRVHLQTASILVNLLMLQDTFPSLNVFNAPLWTVAIEIKIYLLFPFFMYTYQRRGVTLMLIVACAIGYGLTALTLATAPNAELGHSCIWYVALFGMGMSAALGAVGKSTLNSRKWSGLWLLAFGVASASLLWEFPVTSVGEAALFVPHLPYIDSAVGAFAALFLYSVTREAQGTARTSRAIKLLSWRPLVFVGSFAYSLYLTHYPLITYLSLAVDRIPQLAGMSRHTLPFTFVTVPLLFASAYLFFLVFERPFLSSTSRAGTPRGLALHTGTS